QAHRRAGQEAGEEHRRHARLVPEQGQQRRRQLAQRRQDDDDAQDPLDGPQALAHSQVAPVWNRALTVASSRLSMTNRMTWSSGSITRSWWAISSLSPRTRPPMVVAGGSSSSSRLRPMTWEVRRSPRTTASIASAAPRRSEYTR